MTYLCLGYLNMEAFDRAPEDVKRTILGQCGPHCETLRATGRILAEAGLEHTGRARSIRPQRGRPRISDGPFLETKEQLGSFFIVEAADTEEAVGIASMHPAALLGEEYGFGIEVRPIQPGANLMGK
jgi:hypothetical protein